MPLESLLERQNRDGGWPYFRGVSWTEPTAYAVLALLAAGRPDTAARGLAWLAARQRDDGGWPPQPAIDQSAWVTALAALVPPGRLGPERHARAIAWLTSAEGEESTRLFRFREWLLGNSPPPETKYPGWPWVPGAAAWVTPTSLAILGLRKEYRRRASAQVRTRIEDGHRFLLARTCGEGGWNHGGVRPLGYESRPYPETTGLALLALGGIRSPKVDLAVRMARQFLSTARSPDAGNWLRLGLAAHKALPSDVAPTARPPHTATEEALSILADAALSGRNIFLEDV